MNQNENLPVEEQLKPDAEALVKIGQQHYQTSVRSGKHEIKADEPEELKGSDTGMSPFNLLLASLGSCTAITLRMYIDRKMWDIEEIDVKLELFRSANTTLITRAIQFKGHVTDEQHKRLLQIANNCPVLQILSGQIEIRTS